MNKKKFDKGRKLVWVLFLLLGLYGCGEKQLTRMEELELEAAQKGHIEQETTEKQQTVEKTTDTSVHSNKENNVSNESPQDDLIIIDDDNLLNGYWFIVNMAGDSDTMTFPGHEGEIKAIELLHMEGSNGEILDIEPGYAINEISDFVIKGNGTDNEVVEGIGQKFTEHWDYNYSMRTEIAFKPINNQVGMFRNLDIYSLVSSDTYIAERISENEYDYYNSFDFNISEERESLRARAVELKKKYSNNVEQFFGSQSFGNEPYGNEAWILRNEQEFGEYGRGGDMDFTDQQQSNFKGKDMGEVFPQLDSNEFDELYYSFSSLQENFKLSKNEKYGVITLASKGGIMDAVLIGEQEGALEAKNSFVNLLLKATKDKQDITVRVTDSSNNIYLGISNGDIRFELE